MSLAVKYRPKTFEDVVEQNTVTEILENICESKSLDNRNFLLIGSAGCGKAQPLYTNILTPDGYIAMRNIEPGTTVFTAKGNPAKVLGVYPQGKRPIYEIGLQDRTTIRVSDDHLNVVFRYNTTTKQKEYKTLTTCQLIELFNSTKTKIRIDIPSVEFNDDSSRLDTAFDVGEAYTRKKLHVGRKSNQVERYTSLDSNYVFSSKSVRLELFKGMMMSSTITPEGYVKFSTVDDEISKNVTFVARSLGIRVTEGMAKTSKGSLHVLYFHPPKGMNVVEHHKDADRFREHRFDPTRNIEYIKYIGEEECQCIYVDDPDHTYICEEGFIPTHNTTSARIMANMLNDGKGEPIEIDAASHNGVDSVREIIQQAKTYPVGSNYKVFIIDECFHKNTLVNTPDGLVKISDIHPGDVVCSANMYAKVKSVKVNKVITHNLVKLVLDNDTVIVTTTHHLFFTKRGWIEAGLLKLTDKIFRMSSIHYACKDGDIAYPTSVDGYFNVSEYDDSFVKMFQTPKFTNSVFENDVRSKDIPSDLFCSVKQLITYDESPIEFLDYFDKYDLGSEIVDMYDLEIDGYPSYYVDGVMVHNCHSFSNQAWQVLLKTLEESPAKSVFIFATTNPEKIPDTILSRVQTFQLSKISLKGIHDRLCYVLDCEKSESRSINYTDDAVNYIAKLAQGGMRDALTTLDKALAYSQDITVENLSKALNLPKYDDYFELLSAYAKKDNTQITCIIDKVYNSGINFAKWMESFHSFVINIVKYIFMQDIGATMIPSYYNDKISSYGIKHSAICLRLANKLVQLNHELKTTQYQQELALTYLCSIPKSQN